MGDKTQLLSLILVARYKKPWTILLGVLVATLLNHALASYFGSWVASHVPPQTLIWILAASFFACALWILVPDKEGEIKAAGHFGAFLTTVVAFFIAEMGDKTQLVTALLAAKFNPMHVTLGSTAGMLISNALAIFLGQKLMQKIPLKWVRITASLLFAAFGVYILIRGAP
jgi:putative Ca2+/H+ antiporter (TMEM165/GDT1 family)